MVDEKITIQDASGRDVEIGVSNFHRKSVAG